MMKTISKSKKIEIKIYESKLIYFELAFKVCSLENQIICEISMIYYYFPILYYKYSIILDNIQTL